MQNVDIIKTSIKNWAEDDRPREKMLKHGAQVLSNAELLGIIINNGNKEKSAVELAKAVLMLGQNNLDELGRLTLADLQTIKGIGLAKAIAITAALEIGRRRSTSTALDRLKLTTSKDVAEYLRTLLKDEPHENFIAIYLNNAQKVKSYKLISKGGITSTVADPKVILKEAIEQGASSIILSHNHPSGNLKPSMADKELTHKVKLAASYLDIKVLDHIIVSNEGYYSFADEGEM